jgi:hypothetical protein
MSDRTPTPPRAYEQDTYPKILYVGGFGRSGSTLVGRILGQAPDSLCIGETCYLGTRGLLENVQCGCGQPFRACAFWSAVGEEAFGGWGRVDVERLIEIDKLTGRYRTLPVHWSLSKRSRLASAIDDYISWLSRFYAAIARISGARIIVETSKDPYFAALLARMQGCDVRIVHLVRDSRAVAYSWTRHKHRPSPVGEQRLMPQFRPADTAIRWMVSNTALHTLATRVSSYTRVKYEEFILNPSAALDALSGFAGSSLCLPPTQLQNHSVKLGSHHIFSGNPMRSTTGWLEMSVDDEWQRMLPALQFAEVTALTWPLLRLYGYATVPAGWRHSGHPGADTCNA